MRLAQTLERRTNAERRLSRKNRRRTSLAVVVHPAAPSTVPDVGDDMPCRVATVHPPRPSHSSSIDLVGVVSDVPPSPLPIPTPPSAPALTSRTYINAGTNPLPIPSSCDVGVNVSPPLRSFSDAAVGYDTTDSSYGVVTDFFARDLARLLPWDENREHSLARTIWLSDWESHLTDFDRMPPILRVYLHTLFMLFRPGAHPSRRASIPPAFEPVYNLFAHWGTAWNALPTPWRPREQNPERRYYYLTQAQIDGTAPLNGRGYILERASFFS